MNNTKTRIKYQTTRLYKKIPLDNIKKIVDNDIPSLDYYPDKIKVILTNNSSMNHEICDHCNTAKTCYMSFMGQFLCKKCLNDYYEIIKP
jgi:type III secretory pathway lipoprotein EscJ